MGRNSLAALLVKRILEVDPLTPINQGFLGWYNYCEGHFDNALKILENGTIWNLIVCMPLWYIGLVMVFSKNFEDAYTFIDNKCQQHPDSIFLKFSMLLKYSLQKKKEEVLKLLTEDIKQIGWNDYHLPWFIAECYALLEEKEQSIKWLEHAVEWGFINYPLLSEIDPLLENIRGEERFKKLMERVKYEWENFEV